MVLTHDVESVAGLEECTQLMEMERKLGFRSAFNFIPEGPYSVSRRLRQDLEANGFEIGVHDLRHDGRLYRSKDDFTRCAERINEYLAAWNAVGFRSAFMHHRLEWLHDLDIEYDTSTFDTDPFEPQPDGVNTIFPFWVSGPNGGYVELPYTLPQDSTLFLLFREKNIGIWRTKLDWVAKNGGMVLVNVHPDYIGFNGAGNSARKFPVKHYQELLEYIRERYDGTFWQALPKEVADYVRESRPGRRRPGANGSFKRDHWQNPKAKIWIDLDNTPHVPFFLPILRELRKRGHEVVCTARDAFQVCELATQKGMAFKRVGRHYGKNKLAKVYGVFYRAMQLKPVALRERPDIAVSHGSRSQVILSNFLNIPSVLLTDYEYAKYPPLMRPQWEMVPEAIPNDNLYCTSDRIRKYPGIKEDVYVPEFQPDPSILEELGLKRDQLIVTVRPPATEAHYHNPESEGLFFHLMDFLLRRSDLRAVLLPRNNKQAAWIRNRHPEWFSADQVVIPHTAIDGLNLLFHSDLVVSGGGTMNREAAALGVPVYSIFRGQIGAVDRHLEDRGLLVLIHDVRDLEEKIKLHPRAKTLKPSACRPHALDSIVSHIEEIFELICLGRQRR